VRIASAAALIGGLVSVGLINAPANAGPAKLLPNSSGDIRATYVAGNIQDGKCPQGLSEVSLPNSISGSNINITSAGFVGVIYVKGGPAYNVYNFPPLTSPITGLHPPVNNGGNIAGISHWFACGSQPPPPQEPVQVFVGYADNLHVSSSFPSPWDGSPGVIFQGCVPGQCAKVGQTQTDLYDAGAIRIDNPGPNAVTVSEVKLVINTTCVYQLWPSSSAGGTVVPAGGKLIVTQTGGPTDLTPGCPGTTDVDPATLTNFDTTDAFGNMCNNGFVPHISFKVDGVSQTHDDSTMVLTAGGSDPSECTGVLTNEGHAWTALA